MKPSLSAETLAAQALGEIDPEYGALVPPIHPSTTGMRTLFLRVRRAPDTALALARHFYGHSALTAVLYPGLPSHPGHGIAARQMAGGFGGMLSIRIAGSEAEAMAVAGAVQVFKRATSLGGVESLIEPRRRMEGPSSPVPADLLRLSIGLEALDDLTADLDAALGTVKAVRPVGTSVVSAEHPPMPTPRSDFAGAVVSAVDRRVAPTIVAPWRCGACRRGQRRGRDAGGERVAGAVLPVVGRIDSLLRAAVPAVSEVRVVWPNGERAAGTEADEAIHRIRQVLDDKVNPAIAAHGGRVAVVDFIDGRASIR